MKALRFEKTGDLRNLAFVDCPPPVAGDGEVLVRVKAAGLNKSDTSNVLGHFPYTTLPRTPGRDFAGVVIDGPAALIGKAVWGTGDDIGFSRDGSHAEFLAVPADAVSPKPQTLSFAEAASCGVPFITAWHALDNTRVGQSSRLLVIGAAGAVGSAALQLARLRGAEVVGAVRRREHAAVLNDRGFASLLLAEGRPLAEAVRAHFSVGADVIFDTTGFWLEESVRSLARFGRVAVIVVPGDGRLDVPLRELYRRGASIVGINSLLYSGAECGRILAGLVPEFENGRLRAPDRLSETPLECGPKAYGALRRGQTGKFVLIPPE